MEHIKSNLSNRFRAHRLVMPCFGKSLVGGGRKSKGGKAQTDRESEGEGGGGQMEKRDTGAEGGDDKS